MDFFCPNVPRIWGTMGHPLGYFGTSIEKHEITLFKTLVLILFKTYVYIKYETSYNVLMNVKLNVNKYKIKT